MTSVEILEMSKYGEHIHLECKKAEATLPNSVWETYSSFANTDGGVILFGVEEHLRETDFERRFSFVTINNNDQRIKDFWNTVNSEKVSSNILVDADVGTVKLTAQRLYGSMFSRNSFSRLSYLLLILSSEMNPIG